MEEIQGITKNDLRNASGTPRYIHLIHAIHIGRLRLILAPEFAHYAAWSAATKDNLETLDPRKIDIDQQGIKRLLQPVLRIVERP